MLAVSGASDPWAAFRSMFCANRLRMVPYTSAISTTQIVRRIAARLKDGSLEAKL